MVTEPARNRANAHRTTAAPAGPRRGTTTAIGTGEGIGTVAVSEAAIVRGTDMVIVTAARAPAAATAARVATGGTDVTGPVHSGTGSATHNAIRDVTRSAKPSASVTERPSVNGRRSANARRRPRKR